MGDAADLILEGILDEETGELIDGEATGYPRSPAREARHRMRRRKPAGTTKCALCGKLCRGDAGLAAHHQAKRPTEPCPVEVRS